MGLPTAPLEAAPAYEDVVHIHPVNRLAPSGSDLAYGSIPQEDIEHNALAHVRTSPRPAAPVAEEPASQTIAGISRSQPHSHCDACDEQFERRERRAVERHCCVMVAWVFIVLFGCGMILGITIVSTAAKSSRHGLT